MSLVVLAMAVTLIVLESPLLTTAAAVFIVVLLVPSIAVDLLVLFSPKVDPQEDRLLARYRSRSDSRREGGSESRLGRQTIQR